MKRNEAEEINPQLVECLYSRKQPETYIRCKWVQTRVGMDIKPPSSSCLEGPPPQGTYSNLNLKNLGLGTYNRKETIIHKHKATKNNQIIETTREMTCWALGSDFAIHALIPLDTYPNSFFTVYNHWLPFVFSCGNQCL